MLQSAQDDAVSFVAGKEEEHVRTSLVIQAFSYCHAWLPIRPVFADGLDSRRSRSLKLYMEWFDRVFWDWGHASMHVSCFFTFFFRLALGPVLHACILRGAACLSCLEKTQKLHANAIRRVWHRKDNAIRVEQKAH